MGETTNKTKLAKCFSLFELGNVYIGRGVITFASSLIYVCLDFSIMED